MIGTNVIVFVCLLRFNEKTIEDILIIFGTDIL